MSDSRAHERRSKRSDDVVTALHYQLSRVRAEAELETLVLVDESGCLIAGAGAWHTCEELAAFTPLLAEPRVDLTSELRGRMREVASDSDVRSLSVGGASALLCGSGGGSRRVEALARAARGCERILAA